MSLYTVGHSTCSFDEFLALLQAYRIVNLVDVRSCPGSRRFPHFGRDILPKLLEQHG
ncbi:MAG: DUF488 family protein [Acidobacteriota bacterium]